MLNLSIMPLDGEHIKEITDDIIESEKNGAFTHAMLTMYFQPEGTPPKRKAEIQCRTFDKYRKILDAAKYGVLVQSTMGHISNPPSPNPFTPTVSLVTGEMRYHTCCPLDPLFREHMKSEMRELARHSPSLIMLDDDIGLLYRDLKGCACPLHMAEFNRRAGARMSREELYQHTLGTSDEDKRYTEIYVDTVRDSIVGLVKAMREGIDEVDSSIQGIVSGIYVSTFMEFSTDTAAAFCGEGNPKIARLNGGAYTAQGARGFTKNMYRAALLRENARDKIDIFLAETDTCPQNRYSMSAALLHSHFTSSIFEGAAGAKHWITRMSAFEPRSGTAYRRKLSKYSKFYERLSEISNRLQPFGCRIPLSTIQDWGFRPYKSRINPSAWSTCVLERLGLPLYFSNSNGGAVFLDDYSVGQFTDEEIKSFLSGTLILSGGAAESLISRGFTEHLGVTLRKWSGKSVTNEAYGGVSIARQVDLREIVRLSNDVSVLSYAQHKERGSESENLFASSTFYKNALGGNIIVFSGTPDTPFTYYQAFSFLTETRKRELIDILLSTDNLPLYYPGDAEIYLRAGYLDGKIFAAFFNLGLDELDEVPIANLPCARSIKKLCPDGEFREISFAKEENGITVNEKLGVLEPLILLIEK